MAENSILPVEETARDFKLRPCFTFAQEELHIHLPSEPFKPVLEAFANNLGRLQSTIMLPIFNIQFSCALERAVVSAEFEVTGKVDPELSRGPRDQRVINRSQVILDEAADAEKKRGEMPDFERERKFKLADAFLRWSMVSAAPFSAITRGVEALLISLILGMWTSFETMAGDLWEAALNAHPDNLSELKGHWKRLRKRGSPSAPSGEVEQTKQVPLHLIQMNKFDLRNSMGTILRERFSFDRLAGVREAYGSAFVSTPRLDAALTWISQTRSALVR
jgi:hypothetical protein